MRGGGGMVHDRPRFLEALFMTCDHDLFMIMRIVSVFHVVSFIKIGGLPALQPPPSSPLISVLYNCLSPLPYTKPTLSPISPLQDMIRGGGGGAMGAEAPSLQIDDIHIH